MKHPTRSPAELRSMFGANLQRLSQAYPSRSELARQLGINRTQFNRYLSGESFPRPDILDRICTFFNVDARILLEPLQSLQQKSLILNTPFLSDFMGQRAVAIHTETLPSGLYAFSRRSFLMPQKYLQGLIQVFRGSNNVTFIKGYESREAVQFQGMAPDKNSREYRGYAVQHDEGVSFLTSRRKAQTAAFTFIARVPSIQNNFWSGHVSRAGRDDRANARVTRVVYEYLGQNHRQILATARKSGFMERDALEPFHQYLLRTNEG